MIELNNIAGVVLAGGRSSRMGQDKAHLQFNGKKLADHMVNLLHKSGLQEVFVSGRVGETCTSFECRCLPDSAPFAGPASAIRNVLSHLQDFEGVLFLPVDMPFLTSKMLYQLMQQKSCAHFESGPLPLYLMTNQKPGTGQSIKDMLVTMDVKKMSIPLGQEEHFRNINTPKQWRKAMSQ